MNKMSSDELLLNPVVADFGYILQIDPLRGSHHFEILKPHFHLVNTAGTILITDRYDHIPQNE